MEHYSLYGTLFLLSWCHPQQWHDTNKRAIKKISLRIYNFNFLWYLVSQKAKLTEEIVENDRGFDMNENCNEDKEINHNKTKESPTIILTGEY